MYHASEIDHSVRKPEAAALGMRRFSLRTSQVWDSVWKELSIGARSGSPSLRRVALAVSHGFERQGDAVLVLTSVRFSTQGSRH
jgi:hypothetical protein